MELTLYQVDAFADRLFAGNPAAVCPLQEWLPDATMQAIAGENNLSETAFFVAEPEGLRIRWFTPSCEVKLCGHATLASGYVYFHHVAPQAGQVVFNSLSGPLTVSRHGDLLTLDFPATPVEPVAAPALLESALGARPLEVYAADDWLVVLDSAERVRKLQPSMALLRQLERRGVIVTARGDDCDFVSRFFAPKYGIDEDPVTGSAHTKLTPYWALQLGKAQLRARQLSARGGELQCELRGARVLISGRVVPYLTGSINLGGGT
ncbi:MAG: PhzF family phenazine biosynthesis protein [Pseudomonadota bacterium]